VTPKIKNILFPVDFSERACGSAPFVAGLAKQFGAKVTVLHAVDFTSYVVCAEGPPIIPNLDTLRDEAQAHLNSSLHREFHDLPVKRIAQIGSAAETIVRFAETGDADLMRT
jgi:nucleotide-binding universal stress UspA family protein